MSSLDKMLGILGLFRENRTRIRMEDVIELTGASRATAYRYLQSLTDAGLLAPATGGSHALGPRIIELDRLMRMTDPLLTQAAGPLRELSDALRANVMLCSYYGDKVMCVDLIWPDSTVPQAYERGRPMPMFRGAMAKTILAHLPPYHLRNIMAWHAAEIRAAGLGESWDEFRSQMARLRRAGIVVTRAEVVPRLIGLGAPLFDREQRVLGSLVLAIPEERFDREGLEIFSNRLSEAAEQINTAIFRSAEDASLPTPKPARPRPPSTRGLPPVASKRQNDV
jgi:DNA-binding IclR family transcriptional regulator